MGAARDEQPAVARQRVRRALRDARKAAHLIQGDVAARLRWSLSKVQRIESGEVGVSDNDLRALLKLYGVVDESVVERLAADAAVSRRQRWTVPADHREHLTPALRQLMQFESMATAIRAYQPFLFPGVLQTPAMAEHVLGWYGKSLTARQREVRFDVRMARARRVVESDEAPHYYLIVDEAALGREVGGRAVMAEQLEAVVRVARRPNIEIRIVKLADGATVGMLGAFTLVDLSADDAEDAVLYQESYNTDSVIHDPAMVTAYRERFEAVWPLCYGKKDSLNLLDAAAVSLRAALIRDGS